MPSPAPLATCSRGPGRLSLALDRLPGARRRRNAARQRRRPRGTGSGGLRPTAAAARALPGSARPLRAGGARAVRSVRPPRRGPRRLRGRALAPEPRSRPRGPGRPRPPRRHRGGHVDEALGCSTPLLAQRPDLAPLARAYPRRGVAAARHAQRTLGEPSRTASGPASASPRAESALYVRGNAPAGRPPPTTGAGEPSPDSAQPAPTWPLAAYGLARLAGAAGRRRRKSHPPRQARERAGDPWHLEAGAGGSAVRAFSAGHRPARRGGLPVGQCRGRQECCATSSASWSRGRHHPLLPRHRAGDASSRWTRAPRCGWPAGCGRRSSSGRAARSWW